MRRTWFILIISIIVLIISFIFFIFPGYYFTLESKRAASTSSGIPPSSPSASLPFTSSGGPTPSQSGSSAPSSSGSKSASPSASASSSVSASISASVSASPSTSEETIWEKIYDIEKREEKIKSLSEGTLKPISGAAAAAVATGLLVVPLLSLALNFPWRDFFYFLFNSIFSFLGLRKRRRPWGTIYDSLTKKPVGGAIVKVIEAGSNRVRETRVTDKDGRFGFLVGRGKYYLAVAKAGYLFPSKKITLDNKGSDGYFSQVYLGGAFKLREGFLGKNIPLDLQDEGLAPGHFYLFFLRFARFFEQIRLPLLIFGTFLALLNLYLFRSILDLIIVLVYLLLWLFEILERRKARPFARVLDEEGSALDLAVVRVFGKKDDKLLATSITDKKGRFFVLLPAGKYYLTASKSGYFLSTLKNIRISSANPREIKVLMKKSSKSD